LRSRPALLFVAGILAGAFLFYALAWRTGALVPGHWLTLPTRDVLSPRATPVPSVPTIPFPTPTPGSEEAPAASTDASSGESSPAALGPEGNALPPVAIGAASVTPSLLARALPVPTLTLLLPVAGAHIRNLSDNFDETRGGTRRHEAIDILAPRGTAVLAAVDGPVAKLFTSQQGGLTVYQFDRAGEYCYYYAHLDRYAPGLAEGAALKRGDRVGDVGTTGNAPKDTPHLHFAIFRLGDAKRWWEGQPVNPFPLLQKAEER
jgi:murein DD-endopeptidase MepM/ murein hydrolase activator NlpD